ncbi:DUF3344 domain-containing protein [Streptomyces bluensis]|uniref:DUF3344 domain-containing protein n=1 Tax=Streptomyces bluensis TaxID=33897 RepID=UPI00167BFA9C|nr:DUF3344 domain-containing protein [Streptomyces bluensis]GGZ73328.1 hypothetical protein GCM10010344_45360 [Streptomyces bluensis]
MRHSLGPLLPRAAVGVLALTAMWAPGSSAAAPTAPPAPESRSVPFTQRYRAVQHGGIVRAANSSVTCETAASSCGGARDGSRAAANGDFEMTYVDVDSDPNTYNSSHGELRLPKEARVTYARLYWGGNLRVGEQKPPEDNGRVLIAESGGAYKEVLADSVVGHQAEHGADAFQASADVTSLVRSTGPGLYTVAQVNVARGRSAVGSWGGWTLVVAYEKESEPLRHLGIWDGFDALTADRDLEVRMAEMPFPEGAGGRVGLVAYNGDRGSPGDAFSVAAGDQGASALGDGANPQDDVLNSTISEFGEAGPDRAPAHPNTFGYDSDVLDLREGIRRGGDRLTFRVASRRSPAWVGALFVAVDARP